MVVIASCWLGQRSQSILPGLMPDETGPGGHSVEQGAGSSDRAAVESAETRRVLVALVILIAPVFFVRIGCVVCRVVIVCGSEGWNSLAGNQRTEILVIRSQDRGSHVFARAHVLKTRTRAIHEQLI